MEHSRHGLTLQRGAAGLILAASLGLAIIENRSPLAASIRAQKPWPFWLTVPTHGAPSFNLGIYDPLHRGLTVIHLPEHWRIETTRSLSRAYLDALRSGHDAAAAERAVAGLLQERLSALSLEPIPWGHAGHLRIQTDGVEDGENASAAARTLMAQGGSARAWAALAVTAERGLLRADPSAIDPLLLSSELRQVRQENVRPAHFPDDASAPVFLAGVFNPQPAAENENAVVVEVLNATDHQGLAAQAKKMLISSGVDVIFVGTASRLRKRTVVYDRIGDYARAWRVREILSCPTAITATRIDVLRGVDVSVELGGDCTKY